MKRLLVISSLYPNAIQPRHGIFVETRLRRLLAAGDTEAVVIAPVPWFPFSIPGVRYSDYAQVPGSEVRHGIEVHHPRYLVIPKVGMVLTPILMALALLVTAARLRASGVRWDVVDAHYYYPDGVAVAMLSRFLAKPFTVTARGTDINLIPQYRIPRAMILWAAEKAAASITVCAALRDRMVELGAEPKKIRVLRNGVDLETFRPLDREACREKYDITGFTLLSVGHLIERKGHNHVIDALTYLPDVDLVIAGDGEESERLHQQAERLGLSRRVRFLGAVGQDELAEIYTAVDIMVLASSREGWANVLLESMACGTPVVATDIWGTPEVVTERAAGVLVESRSGQGIAEGVSNLRAELPARDATRAYAERFSWDDTVDGITRLLGELDVEPAVPLTQ